MNFKKLEVSGFKSFADKLQIKFGSGITAIVGPNGCGKSNVADSIRWVLGEQSAKLLRGSSMQDVIFNGTEKRKSLSFCEVSLFFDNSNRMFDVDYDELVITRKLYRNGESEYCINKNTCRLKDIVDMLRDSGLGREGYSIIGQGRIDQLLSAKPEDRRAIFEEAAGISKFRARKVETERRLARSQENLDTINAILVEKSRILEPLTKQSETARKYLEMRDRLRNLEINTYLYQYDTANHAKEVINGRLNGVLEEIDMKTKESDNANSDYNEMMDNIGHIDKNISSLRDELLSLTVGMEKQAGESKLITEKRNNILDQISRLEDENTKLNAEHNALLQFVENGQNTFDQKALLIAELKKQNESTANSYLEIMDTIADREGEVENNNKAIIEAMDKLTDIKSNMSRLLAEKEALIQRIADLDRRKTAIDKKNEDSRDCLVRLAMDIEKLVKDKNNLSEIIDSMAVRHNECLSLITNYARELDKITEKFYMHKSRYKLLSDLKKEYDGYGGAVKLLLTEAKTNPFIAERIMSIVAEIVAVPKEFETAIEIAFGKSYQNIVSPTDDNIKELIQYLKNCNGGRATFLPYNVIKPKYLEENFKKQLNIDGVFGIASELVTYDKTYENIIQNLLGRIVIVRDIQVAIQLAKRTNYNFKIVTLDGDVINPQGAITGGSKKSDVSNIFAHDRELKELTATIAEINGKVEELSSLRTACSEEQSDLMTKLKNERENIHKLDLNIATKMEAKNKLTSGLEDAEREVFVLTKENQSMQERIIEIETDINSVGELENLISSKKNTANTSREEQKHFFDALRVQRDALHDQMTAIKIKLASNESEATSLESELARLKSNILSGAEQLEKNNVEIANDKRILSALDEAMTNIIDTLDDSSSERLASIKAKLDNLDNYKLEKQNELTRLDSLRLDLHNLLQELITKRSKEEMLLSKVDTDIDLMKERILEEYQLEYNECLSYREENYDLNKGVAESNKIKRQIQSLGHININAIEDCKREFESYSEMTKQKEDVDKAVHDMKKIISDLSKEMVDRFGTEFEKIRTNFVKIFRELFDGGNADLQLLDNEDLLSAGIEIFAQPPEKKLQSISLLSGGERALTAIAILFAILRLKPMPFCVLDEIEAALDDANAGRFAQYLHRFSTETQFIVITHRKPTMELADNLYGVTMEEKGVSKIVSVKLSEATKLAETNPA